MDKIYYLLFWISLFPFVTQAKFKSLHCQIHMKDYGAVKECEIKAISRTKNLINVSIELYKTLSKGVMLQVQILKRANGWHPFLYDFKVDVCKFLRKPDHLIAKVAFNYLKPFTNINHTCPYEAGSILMARNFDLDVDNLRSRFPFENGEYGINLSLFLYKELLGAINGSIYHFDYKDQ